MTRLTAGVDEAGRGPLAGPVVVAAVILDPAKPIAGLDDSKRLSAARREFLFPRIIENAIAWSVVEVCAETIDALNILQATLWGMQQAVARLSPKPHRILIDGNRAPDLSGEVHTIVGGDRLEPAISAASILAKVSRDNIMREMHTLYPQYGFDQHKGYPTPAHLLLLERFGACAIHRRSFAPVSRLLTPYRADDSLARASMNCSIAPLVTGPRNALTDLPVGSSTMVVGNTLGAPKGPGGA